MITSTSLPPLLMHTLFLLLKLLLLLTLSPFLSFSSFFHLILLSRLLFSLFPTFSYMQLVDVEKKIASEKSKNFSEANVTKTQNKEEMKTTANPSTVASSQTEKKTTISKKTENNTKKADEEEDEEEENENKIRGYKLTTDGRKTTFFNNELDEETKALIGNIAPQKLESNEVPQGVGVSNGGSAWNAAGTFESVDHCKIVL